MWEDPYGDYLKMIKNEIVLPAYELREPEWIAKTNLVFIIRCWASITDIHLLVTARD